MLSSMRLSSIYPFVLSLSHCIISLKSVKFLDGESLTGIVVDWSDADKWTPSCNWSREGRETTERM